MKTPVAKDPPETTLTSDVVHAARYWLDGSSRRIGGRRGLIVATASIVGLGLAFNWSWLVAVGVAPLLVTVLPCAAMCALGLCMNRGAGRPRSSGSNPPNPANAVDDDAAANSHAADFDDRERHTTDESSENVVAAEAHATHPPRHVEKTSTSNE